MNNQNKMTLVGLLAILLWSSIVGLIRSVSNSFGPIGGAAMIYTLATLILFVSIGFPNLKVFPKKYLIWGSLFFVSYELCLSLSIGFAHTAQQAIEVGMVNYLWPTFTLIAAIIFTRLHANFLIVPGVIASMLGIVWVLGGDQGFSLPDMLNNIQDNPLSYGLAFLGALIWAAYSIVTAKYAKGNNGITFFFMLVAGILWVKYLLIGGNPMDFNFSSTLSLFLAAAAMGFGYAAWNIGIMYGNITVLAGASYFTPILSAALAAFILQSNLPFSFWQGTAFVCGGSILSWLATHKKKKLNVIQQNP